MTMIYLEALPPVDMVLCAASMTRMLILLMVGTRAKGFSLSISPILPYRKSQGAVPLTFPLYFPIGWARGHIATAGAREPHFSNLPGLPYSWGQRALSLTMPILHGRGQMAVPLVCPWPSF